MTDKSTEYIAANPAKVFSWIGHWVLLKYMTGPGLSGVDEEVTEGAPKARSGIFFLVEVSSLGIVIIRHPPTDPEDWGAFVPWSSVLVMVGPQTERQQEPKQPEEEAESPLGNYDALTVSQILELLDELSIEELKLVRDYESKNKNRISLMKRLDAKIKASP